jgi:hypothetical protein
MALIWQAVDGRVWLMLASAERPVCEVALEDLRALIRVGLVVPDAVRASTWTLNRAALEPACLFRRTPSIMWPRAASFQWYPGWINKGAPRADNEEHIANGRCCAGLLEPGAGPDSFVSRLRPRTTDAPHAGTRWIWFGVALASAGTSPLAFDVATFRIPDPLQVVLLGTGVLFFLLWATAFSRYGSLLEHYVP